MMEALELFAVGFAPFVAIWLPFMGWKISRLEDKVRKLEGTQNND